MSQQQYGGSLGGPIAQDRTFYFANVEQRRLDQSGLVTIIAGRTSRSINARLAAVGYPGPPVTTGIYPNPGATAPNVLGKIDHQFSGRDQFSVRYSLYDVDVRQLARRRRPERAVALGGPGQPRSDGRGQQHADASVAHRQRDARAVRPQRPAGAADRPDRPGRQHRRRGVVRHARPAARPAALNKMYQVVNNLSHQARRARAARRRRLPLQRRHDHLPALGARHATRSRRWRTSSPASTTTPASRRRSATPTSRRPTRTSASTRRTSGRSTPRPDAEPRPALRPAVPRDDRHRHATTCRRGSASRGRRSTSQTHVVRGSAGLFYDRVPLRALANALLSAGNTHRPGTACARSSVSLSPAQAGAPVVPEHPAARRAVGHAGQPDDDGPRPAERVLAAGQRRGRAAARRRAARSASAISTCAAAT